MPRQRRVTLDVVLDAALELVDEEGLDALTMRRLGGRVGTDPAMVYRLFSSKEGLLEALVDRVFRAPNPDDGRPRRGSTDDPTDLPWQEVTRQMAHGIRAALAAHPELIDAAVRRPPRGEVTFRGIDGGLAVLLAAGLSAEDAALGYQALLFYALGFAVLEAPFAGAPDRGHGQQAETHDALAKLSPAEYPHVAATIDHLYGPDLTGQFDYGLRLLIDGLALTTRHDEGRRR